MHEDNIKRKLATILVADVVGFSRLTAEDERWTIGTLTEFRVVIDEIVARHNGRIFNTGGDSVLGEFGSPVEAVRCAVDFQEAARSRNLVQPRDRQVRFRIGINLGDVMVRGGDLLGDGVNVAARLETLAEPGGICVSGTVWDQIYGKLSLGYVDMGEQRVKNIPRPVRAYRLRLDGTVEEMPPTASSDAALTLDSPKKRRFPLPTAAAISAAVFAGGIIAWQFWTERSGVPVQPPATVSIVPGARGGAGMVAALPRNLATGAFSNAPARAADPPFWLNGKWVLMLSKLPVTDSAFCSHPDRACRSFEVHYATGDGEYEVGWSGHTVAHFSVRGQHVSAILPSDSLVEMELGKDGEFNGELVNPEGYKFLVKARKLPRG